MAIKATLGYTSYEMKIPPKLVVMIGVLFSSFASIFVRSSGAPAFAIAMYRMGFSFAMLLPFFIIKGIHRPRRIKTLKIKDFGLCALSGVFLAIHFATWIQSLGMTSIASATVLVDTHPLFILAAGYLFLHERISRKAFFFVIIAFMGIIVLSLGDYKSGTDTFAGDLLALGGAAAVSGYILIGRSVRQRMSAVTYATVVYFFAALTLIVVCAAWRVKLYGYPARELLVFLCIAFFCTILGHTLFNWALKFLKASFVSTAVLIEPVYATLLGIIIFGEIPGALVFIGGGVILPTFLS